MQPTAVSNSTFLMAGIGFLGFFIGVGLIVALVKNLALSQWMKVALFGVLLILSAGLFTLALPLIMRQTGGMGVLFQLIFLQAALRTVGEGFFVVGISGTLFDVRNQLRIANAMLNKPAVDELS